MQGICLGLRLRATHEELRLSPLRDEDKSREDLPREVEEVDIGGDDEGFYPLSTEELLELLYTELIVRMERSHGGDQMV